MYDSSQVMGELQRLASAIDDIKCKVDKIEKIVKDFDWYGVKIRD